MIEHFATNSANDSLGWIQIVVPAAISVLLAALSAWAILAKYQQKVDGLEKNDEKQDNKIDDLKDRVSRLEGGLERDRANSDPYTQRQSPLSLTDKGKALLLDSGGNKYLEENMSDLIEEIKARSPKSAYDVQEYAKNVIDSHTDDDAFVPLKDYLFNEGLKLEDLINVLGVALRDAAFPVLGFTVEEVDESDPSNS